MKGNTIVVSLVLATLFGCSSTAKMEQASAAPVEISNKIAAGDSLTDKELDKLAATTNFTKTQIAEAAKKLGYKCTIQVRTGSHLKKKFCSTRQTRDVLYEAAKRFVQDVRHGSTYTTKS